MIKGKTESGFEFEIDEQKLNDMEYVDDLAEIDENILAFSRVLTTTLGKEGKKRLYDHVRNENGVATVDDVMEEFNEIMSTAGSKTKNS